MKSKLLPVATAVEYVTGQRPNPSTLQRWRLKGVAGIKLNTVRVGGRRLCSEAEVVQFQDAVTAAVNGEQPKVGLNRQRQAEIDIAEAELAEAGI